VCVCGVWMDALPHHLMSFGASSVTASSDGTYGVIHTIWTFAFAMSVTFIVVSIRGREGGHDVAANSHTHTHTHTHTVLPSPSATWW